MPFEIGTAVWEHLQYANCQLPGAQPENTITIYSGCVAMEIERRISQVCLSKWLNANGS